MSHSNHQVSRIFFFPIRSQSFIAILTIDIRCFRFMYNLGITFNSQWWNRIWPIIITTVERSFDQSQLMEECFDRSQLFNKLCSITTGGGKFQTNHILRFLSISHFSIHSLHKAGIRRRIAWLLFWLVTSCWKIFLSSCWKSYEIYKVRCAARSIDLRIEIISGDFLQL